MIDQLNGNNKDQYYKQFKTIVFVGGGGEQNKNKLPVDNYHSVLVGTPGMIQKIIKGKNRYKPRLDLSKVKFFCADEADDLMDCRDQ